MHLRFLSMLRVGVAIYAAKYWRSGKFPMKSVTESRGSIVKRRRSFFMLFGLLLCASAVALAQEYPVPFVRFPFDVTRGGNSLEGKFKVIEDRTYQFDLRFEFADRAEQDRLTEVVGDRPPDPRYGISGSIIPIRLKIISETKNVGAQPVFDRTIDTEGHHVRELARQVDAGAFRRTIADVRLSPGLYHFQAETIRDIPGFSGFRTQFVIGYDARSRGFR